MTHRRLHSNLLGLRGDSGYKGSSTASSDMGYDGSSRAATSTHSTSHLVTAELVHLH